MILHIRLKPDGNGVAYSGTPEELKKHFTAARRAWYRNARAPFETVHTVEVFQTGSPYYIYNSGAGGYYVVHRGKYCPTVEAGPYENFGPALNRLCKLIESEEVERC